MKSCISLFCVMLGLIVLTDASAQLNCNILITRDKVELGGCYNGGLIINKLKVLDSLVHLYPSNYKKLNAVSLIQKKRSQDYRTPKKIYFTAINNNFSWRIYDTVYNVENNDIYANFTHRDKKILGSFFVKDTWYLFNFYNPSFIVFVYVDKKGQIHLHKKKLNTNF